MDVPEFNLLQEEEAFLSSAAVEEKNARRRVSEWRAAGGGD